MTTGDKTGALGRLREKKAAEAELEKLYSQNKGLKEKVEA